MKKRIGIILYIITVFSAVYSQEDFNSIYHNVKNNVVIDGNTILSLQKISQDFTLQQKIEFYYNNYRNDALPSMLFNMLFPCTGLGSFLYGNFFDGAITLGGSAIMIVYAIVNNSYTAWSLFPLSILEAYSLISPWVIQNRQNGYLKEALNLDGGLVSGSLFHVEIIHIAF